MTAIQRVALPIAIAVSLLAGCGKGKDEQLAHGVCLAAAKKEPHFAKAVFGTAEKSNFQASGNAAIRVNIPYELEGKQGLYQCSADKQADGTYRVTLKK